MEGHSCSGCGDGLSGHNLKQRLCSGCAELRRQSSKRIYRGARKAAVRAATMEAFDPFEVLERDCWHCYMCGCATPKVLRGTYADNAPELDHIIPIASGGEHSRRNTACSCRKCNNAKSDKPLGQLRLTA